MAIVEKHGPWSLESATKDYVTWRCTRCGTVVGFWTPNASNGSKPTATKEAYPEEIDIWAGVCDDGVAES